LALFKNVIAPIVTYGIEIVWEKLTVKDLERIEKVKARFMKKVMGVGMNAPSRMAYVLMGEQFFVEEIRLSSMLPTTKPYQDLLRNRIREREEVDIEFNGTSAMIDKNWKKANQEQRQVVTRFAVHGFYHKLCKNK
jgi:hypothetical protein